MTEPTNDVDPVSGIGLGVVLGVIGWLILIGVGVLVWLAGRGLGWW